MPTQERSACLPPEAEWERSDRLKPLLLLVHGLARRAVGSQDSDDVAQTTLCRLVSRMPDADILELLRLAHLALRWVVADHVRREGWWRAVLPLSKLSALEESTHRRSWV